MIEKCPLLLVLATSVYGKSSNKMPTSRSGAPDDVTTLPCITPSGHLHWQSTVSSWPWAQLSLHSKQKRENLLHSLAILLPTQTSKSRLHNLLSWLIVTNFNDIKSPGVIWKQFSHSVFDTLLLWSLSHSWRKAIWQTLAPRRPHLPVTASL